MSPSEPTGSGLRAPVIRHFIACERVEVSEDGKQCSLVNLIHAIRPSPGAEYPLIHPELCLFVQLTDGRGAHAFQVQLVLLEEEETTIRTTGFILRDLGQDPLAVYGWPLRLQNVVFPRPGLYEFRLLCDGRETARQPILLREAP
jgi:hypothetical protein